MKNIFLFSFCIVGLQTINAQVVDSNISDSQEYSAVTKQNNKTLIINTSNLSMNALGELKDELIVWKEKVISININEKTNEFILVHNYFLSDQELFEVLRKYDIQKKHIISYK